MGDGGDDLLNGDAGSDTFLESGVDDAYDSGSIPTHQRRRRRRVPR
ncbi:hypothetical protein [Sorangium sp. So ce296]